MHAWARWVFIHSLLVFLFLAFSLLTNHSSISLLIISFSKFFVSDARNIAKKYWEISLCSLLIAFHKVHSYTLVLTTFAAEVISERKVRQLLHNVTMIRKFNGIVRYLLPLKNHEKMNYIDFSPFSLSAFDMLFL